MNNASNHKILIIEDDFDISEMLHTFFRASGYSVITSHWGEEGVSTAKEQQPNLIILDIRLPDIDGYEVARRIKTDPLTGEIPIIYLTERRDRADRLRGLELGADDYITKPFDMAELKLRVKNVIGRYQPQAVANSVTSLPEGKVVAEQVEKAISEGNDVLYFGIINLPAFSAAFGTDAAEDVVRKTSILIRNSLRDAAIGEYFLGHLSGSSMVLCLGGPGSGSFGQRLAQRLEMAMEFFMPQNSPEATLQENRLKLDYQYIPAVQAAAEGAKALTLRLGAS